MIGRGAPRADAPLKTRGLARFSIDTREPGRLYAAIRHAPRIGGALAHAKLPAPVPQARGVVGGGFGRRADLGYIAKAVEIAEAFRGAPVQTIWITPPRRAPGFPARRSRAFISRRRVLLAAWATGLEPENHWSELGTGLAMIAGA